MSKSVGNVLLLHDLVQAMPGEVVRWALLSAHYRQPLDWNQGLLDQSKKSLDRLYGALQDDREVPAGNDEGFKTRALAGFYRALEDDLNTPGAMAELFALADMTRNAKSTWIPGEMFERHDVRGSGGYPEIRAAFIEAGHCLGIFESTPTEWFSWGSTDALRLEVEALLDQRAAARAAKDWPEADRIRDRLNALNVVVMDGPDGATWRMKG